MSEQQALFDPWERTWIGRTWRAIDPEERREILGILAEMGRAAVAGRPPAARAAETRGGRHEP